jgi:tetratricopeptide (TPR) repeat protein
MQRAIDDYGVAIRYEPCYPTFYSNRAFAYYKLGEYEKGIADCERAIALLPNQSTHYINRGHCFAGLGNLERAANDFRFASARPCQPSESERKEALEGLRSLGLDQEGGS